MRFTADSYQLGKMRTALARQSRRVVICVGSVIAVVYHIATGDVVGASVFLVGFVIIGVGSGTAVGQSKVRRLLRFEYEVNDACVRRFRASGESESIEWMNVVAFSIRSGRFGSIVIKAKDGRVFYIFYPDTYVAVDGDAGFVASLLAHLSVLQTSSVD